MHPCATVRMCFVSDHNRGLKLQASRFPTETTSEVRFALTRKTRQPYLLFLNIRWGLLGGLNWIPNTQLLCHPKFFYNDNTVILNFLQTPFYRWDSVFGGHGTCAFDDAKLVVAPPVAVKTTSSEGLVGVFRTGHRHHCCFNRVSSSPKGSCAQACRSSTFMTLHCCYGVAL